MKRETIRYRWTAALLGIALCAMWQSDATAGDEGARPIPQVSEHRKALQEAVPAYAKGGSWKVFLGTCKELLAANAALTKEHQDSALAYKLKSLIEPLERDLAAPLPAFLKKKPKERTPEETIRYWVHHMQDDARAPSTWLGSPHPTAAEQLMAIGKPAIPFLIDAMDDRTPTRAIVQYPARRARPPYYLPELHRRSDLALRCLRWIVGTNPLHDNHWDKEFLPHLKEWWAMSKGKSQVQMIRNVIAIRQREQLKLQAKHGKQYTLDLRPMAADLATIAMIEGPEKVAPMLRKLLPTDRRDLGLKITYITRQVDPRAALAVRFTRYRAGNPHPFDLRELYTFGDKKTRADIRRFAKTGKNPKMAKLFADNPPAAKDPVDLLWSEEELTAMIHALEGNDPKARVRVLAGLVTARSFQVQRALLRALPKSKSAKERLVILTKLPEMPRLWLLPVLAECMEKDPEPAVCERAGQMIHASIGNATTRSTWPNVESRDVALDAARRIARDAKAPREVRLLAVQILTGWSAFVDHPLLGTLGADPAFKEYAPLQEYLKRLATLQKPPPRAVLPSKLRSNPARTMR